MMKNKYLLALVAIISVLAVLAMSACTSGDVAEDGNYSYTEVNVIPKGESDPVLQSYTVGFGKELDGVEIVFPATYNGKPISGISSWGCSKLSSITSLVIPDVDSDSFTIGTYAFFECKELTTITFPANLKSVAQWAFSYCDKLSTVNFRGSAAQWEAVEISRFGNAALLDANIVFDYVG